MRDEHYVLSRGAAGGKFKELTQDARDAPSFRAGRDSVLALLETKGYFLGEGCRIAPVRARTAASSDKVHTLACAGLAPVASFA